MLAKIINLILFVSLIIGSIYLGWYIHTSGQPITEFCNLHYKNKSFMSTMEDNEPYEVIGCQSEIWRTKWGICNFTCFEMRDKCLEENATREQVYFTQRCGWMESDYWILFGTFFFMIMLPACFAIMVFFLFYEPKNLKNSKDTEYEGDS